MLKRSLIAATAALGLLAGCTKSSGGAAAHKPLVGGLGKELAAGRMTDLRVTPDFRFATYLKDPERPHINGISPRLITGELDAVSLSNGEVRKIGDNVTNSPGGYLFSPDSRWVLYLEGYNAASQAGEAKALDLTRPDSKPIPLGNAVSFFAFSPDSKAVAVVDDGVLKLGPVDGSLKTLGNDVSTAAFTPNSRYLVFRKTLSAGAGLMVAGVGGGQPTTISPGVVEYQLAPDGEHVAFTTRDPAQPDITNLSVSALAKPKVEAVSKGTNSFAYSPDGKWLARTEGFRPDTLGVLVVGPSTGGPGKKIGERSQTFQFSPDSKSIAALVKWDTRIRVGKLAVATLPDVTVHTTDERALEFAWDPKGRFVAYSAQVLEPIFSVDLFLYPVGAKASKKVAAGVYGWSFGPEDDYLMFRTQCLREGRSCDLDVLDLSKESKPQKVLESVYTFKTSPDAKRVLFTYARTDSDTYDAAVYDFDTKKRETLDERTLLPALFAAKDGSRVIYLISGGGREGVYLADTTQAR